MTANLAGKRVLVLSDNSGLAEAIEFNLKRSDLKVVRLALSSPRLYERSAKCQQKSQAGDDDFDLIVVAMSSPSSEPVVALARASLGGRIGQVPMLIISDRPFLSDPDAQIIHLDFPFDIDGLRDRVNEILQGEHHNGLSRGWTLDGERGKYGRKAKS